jgi:hypothetical protein
VQIDTGVSNQNTSWGPKSPQNGPPLCKFTVTKYSNHFGYKNIMYGQALCKYYVFMSRRRVDWHKIVLCKTFALFVPWKLAQNVSNITMTQSTSFAVLWFDSNVLLLLITA